LRETGRVAAILGKFMTIHSTVGIVLLSLASGAAIAGAVNAVPEPGILELLSIGALVGLVVGIRKRRK
jgi:hypothetical protein